MEPYLKALAPRNTSAYLIVARSKSSRIASPSAWLRVSPSSMNCTPSGSSSDKIPEPRMETLVTSVPLSVCRKSPGVRFSKSSKFEARPRSISSAFLRVKPPGISLFCSAAFSAEGEVNDSDSACPVTMTRETVSAELVDGTSAEFEMPIARNWMAATKSSLDRHMTHLLPESKASQQSDLGGVRAVATALCRRVGRDDAPT